MSTFDGLIREFPTVAIDNFKSRPGVKIYLLSHVHSDHLTGLATKAWDAPIYCSQITAKWLPMLATRSKQLAFESGHDRIMERKYAHLAPYLVKAFLLQDDRSCILYTGDSRNEAVDLQGLKTMPIFSSSTPQIDCLYLDTTYCHPAFQEFPSREFAVSDLVNFINRRPRMAHYYIDAWTFGYEEIWIGLAKAFHTKIHVSPYLYELYETIDDMIYPKVLPHLTLDGTTARFHSCRLGRSCGYGGAGGEHSSARELIRIQPNVSWFSAMLIPDRLKQTDNVFAQGQVIGRKLQQLVKLVAPRAVFPCVLHRDSIFNTFYRSNREAIALLSNYLSDSALLLTASEKSKDQQHCRNDVVTTDFQSFHRAKGFQILDMNDEVLGVASVTSSLQFSRQKQQQQEQQGQSTGTIIALTDEGVKAGSKSSIVLKQPSPILSPRSNHLRKKMKKLMRQLRNTTSLEEESGLEWKEENESTLEEGPLSLDLENFERKRKWWMHENDRGQSTTLEDHTGGDETDSQSIGRLQRSNGPVSDVSCQEQQDIVSERKGDSECQQTDTSKGWCDQSTLELVPDMLVSADETEEQQDEQFSNCAAQSVESKGYMSSSSFAGTEIIEDSPVIATLSISGSSPIAASVLSLGEAAVSMVETRHAMSNKVATEVLPTRGPPLEAGVAPETINAVSSNIEYTCGVVSTFVAPEAAALAPSTIIDVKASLKATPDVTSTFVDPEVATSALESTPIIASSVETTSCVSPSPEAVPYSQRRG
ncbi:hypothetical protein BGZ51_007528 [Haplosporangium sp. Z 767]|nr:hypothetical protein BGZ51_007528 [Haplosporangium sp. Z 767]